MAKKKKNVDVAAVETDDAAAKFLASKGEPVAPKVTLKRKPRTSDEKPIKPDAARMDEQRRLQEAKRAADDAKRAADRADQEAKAAMDARRAEAVAAADAEKAAVAKKIADRVEMPPLAAGQEAKYYYVRGTSVNAEGAPHRVRDVIRVVGPDPDGTNFNQEFDDFATRNKVSVKDAKNIYFEQIPGDPMAGAKTAVSSKSLAEVFEANRKEEYKAFRKGWEAENKGKNFFEEQKTGPLTNKAGEGIPRKLETPVETAHWASVDQARREGKGTPRKSKSARLEGADINEAADEAKKLAAQREANGEAKFLKYATRRGDGAWIAKDPGDQAAFDKLFNQLDKGMTPEARAAHVSTVLQKFGLREDDLQHLSAAEKTAFDRATSKLSAGNIEESAGFLRYIPQSPRAATAVEAVAGQGRKGPARLTEGWRDPPELTGQKGWTNLSVEEQRLRRVTHLFDTGVFDGPGDLLSDLPDNNSELWKFIKKDQKALAYLERVGTNAELASHAVNGSAFEKRVLEPLRYALTKAESAPFQVDKAGKVILLGSKLGKLHGAPNFEALEQATKGLFDGNGLNRTQFDLTSQSAQLSAKVRDATKVRRATLLNELEGKTTLTALKANGAALRKKIENLSVGVKAEDGTVKMRAKDEAAEREIKEAKRLLRNNQEKISVLTEQDMKGRFANRANLTLKDTARTAEERLALLDEQIADINQNLHPTRMYTDRKTGAVKRSKLQGKNLLVEGQPNLAPPSGSMQEKMLKRAMADRATILKQIEAGAATGAAAVAETVAEKGPIPIAGEPELSKLATKAVPMGQEVEQRLMAEGVTTARDGTKVVRPGVLSGAAEKLGFMGHAGKWLGPLFAIYGVYETLHMLQDGTIGDADRERLKTLEALGSVGGGVQEDLEQRRTIQSASRMTDLAAIEGQRNKDKMNSQFLDDQALNAMLHGQQASLASIARPSQPSIAEMMSRM